MDINPLAGKMKKLYEDNIHERVLTVVDFKRLLAGPSSPLREITTVAFYLCMRQDLKSLGLLGAETTWA